jgi:hypothetical protein
MQQFITNRIQFPLEELEQYAGKYVAWSPDGTRIIAGADCLAELAAAVAASEFDAKDCVLSSVPHPDEIVLGEADGR